MNINYKKSNLAYCIIAIIVGLLLLIIPKYCIYGIVVILGIFSISNGVYTMVKTRNIISDPDFYIVLTIQGIFSIVIGFLAVLLPAIFAKTAVAIWTVMVYLLAAYFLITAAMELYATVQLKKFDIETKPYISEILFSLITGVVLIFIPPKTFGEVIVRIIGAVVIAISVILIIIMFKNKPIVVYAEEVPSDPNESATDSVKSDEEEQDVSVAEKSEKSDSKKEGTAKKSTKKKSTSSKAKPKGSEQNA